MLCNLGMNDAELIRHLGGPTKVSALLGYDKHGVQRVQNWIKRGIPSHVKVKHPKLFMGRKASKADKAEAA